MARAQKKKAGSPKKKKTSAKVASPKGKKSKEDAIIDLSETGSPLRKFSKSLSEYKPSWEVNGGFRIAIKKLPKAFCLEPDNPPKILCDRVFQAFPSLHHLNGVSGLLYFISVTTGMKYDETNESGPVTVDSIYMAAPLLVAQPMIRSRFLRYLSADVVTENKKIILALFDEALKFRYRFWLCSWFYEPTFEMELERENEALRRRENNEDPQPMDVDDQERLQFLKEEQQMLTEFFTKQFDPNSITDDCRSSIVESLKHNHCLFLFGFTADSVSNKELTFISKEDPLNKFKADRWIAKKREVIAGILYDRSEDGIWVNWLAVSNGIYDPKLFGEAANRSPFRSIGIGTLLLSMIQLESAALGWKTDIFLQVNGNEPSVHFYQSNGFLKCGSNSMQELPRSIRARQSSGDGFVHFVETKQLEQEAKERGDDPSNPVVRQSFLTVFACKRRIVFDEVHDLVPRLSIVAPSIFFSFPLNAIACQLQAATAGMTILQHPVSSFQQTPLQFLTATPVKKKRMGDILDVFFSRADVYLKTYLEFSSDPTMWLNDEIISFASCWLLRDQKLTSQFEFIPRL